MEVGDVYCDIETDKATVSFDCQNECACPPARQQLGCAVRDLNLCACPQVMWPRSLSTRAKRCRPRRCVSPNSRIRCV